ncbi:hypothetical protein Tco_0115540 [Tanacetum coccineum]
MRTRSQSRNQNRPQQQASPVVVEPFNLEEPFDNPPVVNMAANGAGGAGPPPAGGGGLPVPDLQTMEELCQPSLDGRGGPIAPIAIQATNFGLKNDMIQQVQNSCPFREPGDDANKHLDKFSHVTQSMKVNGVSDDALRLHLFPYSLQDHCYKDLLRACPHHGFTELHQLDTFYNALNPADQDSLNSTAGGNLLERSTRDVLTIIKNKSKVRNSRNKLIVSQVKSSDGNSSSSDIAKLTHACLAADGNTFPEYRDNIQGYVAAAAGNYNQGNSNYRPPGVANQTRPPGLVQQNGQNNQNHFSQPQGYNRGNNFNQNATYQAPIQQNQSVPLSEFENFKKTNDVNMKAMQNQISNVKNELRNEMQTSIQASMPNQTNELKNMTASFFQMNTVSTSGTGSLSSNTIANPKGELKAITTRSGLVLDGPSVPIPPPFINPKEDERV